MSAFKANDINVFYDTNFFTNYPFSELQEIVSLGNNFLISSVLEELKIGRSKENCSQGVKYILNDKLELQQDFKLISLDNCDKDLRYKFEIADTMYLKKNPILCSSYYTWINSATNPAIVLDYYRHLYNFILYKIGKDADNPNNLNQFESKLRAAEILMVEKYEKQLGRNRKIEYKWLMQARKKRLKEIKEKKFKLTDYQTIVSALLYACFHGANVMINTLDRDFVDIKENLERSIVERYTVYNLLKEKVINLPILASKVFNSTGLAIDLTIAEIGENVRKFWDKCHSETHYCSVGVYLFNKEKNLSFPYVIKIPFWLRDFILEYKKNVSCMSLGSSYGVINNFTYTFDPNFETGVVAYRLFPNNYYQDRMEFAFCSRFCKYPKLEESNPLSLTEFFG